MSKIIICTEKHYFTCISYFFVGITSFQSLPYSLGYPILQATISRLQKKMNLRGLQAAVFLKMRSSIKKWASAFDVMCVNASRFNTHTISKLTLQAKREFDDFMKERDQGTKASRETFEENKTGSTRVPVTIFRRCAKKHKGVYTQRYRW